MIQTWKKGLTLERIEVNGPYAKDNCEWVIQAIQTRNLEKTIRVELKGRLMTLPEISERYNLNQHTLWYRWKSGKRGDDLIKPVRSASA
ncbi:hypothetical protein LZK73_18390 [Neorhizobium galegae]|nr:hypothetical protein LZK73_18390 [Neorhizobium galegae]